MYESLDDAVRSMVEARTLDEALDAVIQVLRDEFSLWSANMVAVGKEGTVKVVASVSVVETLFTEGTEISITLTPQTAATAVRLMQGFPAVATIGDADFGLVEDILADEGVASLVMIPLHDDGVVAAILSLHSRSASAFEQAIPYFTGLGRGVESHLTMLVRQSGVLAQDD